MAGNVFLRYELKYIMPKEKRDRVVELMSGRMALDRYGKSEIRNLYFDTDDFLLIRRSIEKPIFKEKLRLRSYGKATPDKNVFVEIKRKYNSVVYKRRSIMPESEALFWLTGGGSPEKDTQISREINYFLKLYPPLTPKVFLSYEREAYYDREGSDFRVTFDDNILARTDNLTLEDEAYGDSLLDDSLCLMELKCPGGIPLWMVDILSKERIYKTSFSKYGTAYKTIILPKKKEILVNV